LIFYYKNINKKLKKMPNWCENEITIESLQFNEIKNIIENNNDDKMFFNKFIDIEPKVSNEKYNKNWFYINIDNYGTKWDVDVKEIFIDYLENKNTISLKFSTAWSPPIIFCKRFSEKYNAILELKYFECGCDFSGHVLINNGKITYEKNYSHLEGMFNLKDKDKETFWDYIYSLIVNEYIHNKKLKIETFIKNYNLNFLNENEINTLKELFNKTINEFI
jgi:hypothetical protein